MACLVHRHDAQLLGTATWRDGAADPFPEPGVDAHYGPSRAARVEHLDLRLRLDPVAEAFSGEATLTLRHFPSFAGIVTLDADEHEIVAVTDAAGVALPYTHDDGVLRVRSDATVLRVTFRGTRPARGLYFTGPTASEPARARTAWTQCQDEDAHFVFPCQDHPGTKHPWAVTLEGPLGYTLLSNGRLVETGERDGWAFARFAQDEPMPAYLFTAVAAPLRAVDADFGRVPVRYLVPPEADAETALRAMGRTPRMIEAFERFFGVNFPWPRYDQVVVHDFVFGGMENIACTTMTDLLLVDEKAAVEWDPDGLVAHELAHQWFGDLVTCQDWSQAWLNESFATFCEALWWEIDRPAADATWYRWDQAQSYLGEDGGRYRRPIVSYRFREPIDVFDRHLYEKGACVLATLRFSLGDAAFRAGVREYLTGNAHDVVHTRDLQKSLERASGQNLDRFFEQWVFGAGHPALTVTLATEPGLVAVTVAQGQSGEQTANPFHVGLPIELVGKDGSVTAVTLPIREKERTFTLPYAGELLTVRVDPGFRVLAAVELKGPAALLKPLMTDACPVLALRAAKAGLASGTREGFQHAAATLRAHPFHGVREGIAAAIASRGGPDALEVLLGALAGEGDPRVQRALADGLGAFKGSSAAADALLRLLDGEPRTWHLRGAALHSLGKTRDPRAVAAISAHLGVRSWAHLVTRKALAGLAATEEPAVMGTLVAHTGADHEDLVRAAAAAGIGALAEKVEGVRPRAVEVLSALVFSGGFRVQMAAVQALGATGDPAARKALAEAHRRAPDGRVRRAAFEAQRALGRGKGSEAAATALGARLDALTEENHRLRRRVERLEGKAG